MNANTVLGVTPRGRASSPFSVAPRVLRWAALRAPESLRERLGEEWLAHLEQLRGNTTRLRFVLGCFWAAAMISYENPGAACVPVATANAVVEVRTRPARPRRSSLNAPRNPAANGVMLEINITPLIDVMLVLLVTLIISLPVMTHAVKLEVPRGTPASTVPPVVIDLEIDSDGALAWNGTVLTGLPQLEGYFQAQAKTDSQAEIHLRPERHAKYDVVAKVLALAQRSHMNRVVFANTTEFAN